MTLSDFQIGDSIKTMGFADYDRQTPIGSIGTIVHIRHRYQGTPSEYKQYRIEFDEHSSNCQLKNLYRPRNMEKIY